MTRPIIFLDIDGVLNTKKSQDSWKDTMWEFVKFDKVSYENLNELLTKHLCDIVITTRCWKEDYTLKEVHKIFSRFTLHKDGMSYLSTPSLKGKGRGFEIKKFLERFEISPPYIVLDDDTSEIKGVINDENFVHVSSGWFTGLSKAHIQEATTKLEKQMGVTING